MDLLKRNVNYNLCGAFGHAWDLEGSRLADLGAKFSLRCVRCGAIRTDTMGPRMNLVTRGYDYPDGYKFHGPKPTREELRAAILRQLKVRKRRKTA